MSPLPALLPDELGITEAARLIGVPEVTLRLHVDQGRVMGARKDSKGYRLIGREGLLAYARARGLEAAQAGRSERRGDERIPGADARVRLRFQDAVSGCGLGEGEALLADLSRSGLRIEEGRWTGALPDPSGKVEVEVADGALQAVRVQARAAWIVFRQGVLSAGLALSPEGESGSRTHWNDHVAAEARRKREAELAYARSFDNPWARARRGRGKTGAETKGRS